jgi:hypothetical protein
VAEAEKQAVEHHLPKEDNMIEQSYPNKGAFPDPLTADPRVVYISGNDTKRWFIANNAYVELNPVPPSPQQPIIGA